MRGLADLKPETLAVMDGASYIGKSDKLLTDLAGVIKESFYNGQRCVPPKTSVPLVHSGPALACNSYAG